MPDNAAPRPTQVTLAAAMVVAGSVGVVLSAFERIAGLRSSETREWLRGFFLADWFDLDLQGTLSLVRVLAMVAAAGATAAAILGVQVLRCSRPARLMLTVLAAPIFVGGLVLWGFLPALVVGSVATLWFQPARDWLDGKAPRPAPPRPPPLPSPAAPPRAVPGPQVPDPPTAADQPRAVPGFGEPSAAVPAALPGQVPAGPTAYAASQASPAPPPALMWACALAWAGSAVVFAVMLVSVALVLAAPDMLVDELYRQNPELRSDGITPSTLRSTVLFAGTLLVVWSVVAAVLAVFAWRGRPWAWTALLVSASCASMLCLFAALGSPALLVPLAVVGATIPLLLRPEVRAFIRRSTPVR